MKLKLTNGTILKVDTLDQKKGQVVAWFQRKCVGIFDPLKVDEIIVNLREL